MTLFLTVENRFRRCALLLPARAFSFLLPTHHIPLGVTGIYRLSVLLKYSLILSLPSWKVK